jgi:8-hydroxy-5-deazaflavin:NADPH oxidoreductase
MKNVGVLGSGAVGQTLADGFLKHGYAVMRGSREPAKMEGWKAGAGEKASVGTFAETARFGDVIVLAVKGTAAEEVLSQAGVDALAGKIVIDTTNPIAEGPPQNGVIRYFTGPNDSLMERLQKKAPAAKLVKAFSSVGNARMVNPDFGGVRPSMFICGDDAGARETVKGILDTFGWDTEDLGSSLSARAIEPLCMLWCIPGFLNNSWMHAYKVLR